MPEPLSLKLRALQSQDAIELLSSKWRITILHLLSSSPLRPKDLQSALKQVSPKVLTQTLRGLERDGFIHRKVQGILPPHVEYKLTSMGRSILPALTQLCHWARAHAAERDEARRRFDTALKKSGGR